MTSELWRHTMTSCVLTMTCTVEFFYEILWKTASVSSAFIRLLFSDSPINLGLLGLVGLLHHLGSVCLYCNFHQYVKLSPGITCRLAECSLSQSKSPETFLADGVLVSWCCRNLLLLANWIKLTKYSYEYSVLPGQVSHQQHTHISHR